VRAKRLNPLAGVEGCHHSVLWKIYLQASGCGRNFTEQIGNLGNLKSAFRPDASRRSGCRAGAAKALYVGVSSMWGPEQALEHGREGDEAWIHNRYTIEWVTAGLAR
jgi:hypothetical protein